MGSAGGGDSETEAVVREEQITIGGSKTYRDLQRELYCLLKHSLTSCDGESADQLRKQVKGGMIT